MVYGRHRIGKRPMQPGHIPAPVSMMEREFHEREFGASGGAMLPSPASATPPPPPPRPLVIEPPPWARDPAAYIATSPEPTTDDAPPPGLRIEPPPWKNEPSFGPIETVEPLRRVEIPPVDWRAEEAERAAREREEEQP